MRQNKKLDKIKAIARGKLPERLPYSIWDMSPRVQSTPEVLLKHTLEWQAKYDCDVIIVAPRKTLFLEAWGIDFRFNRDGSFTQLEYPLKSEDDWLKVEVLNVKRGVLRKNIDMLKELGSRIDQQVIYLLSIPQPIWLVVSLCGGMPGFKQFIRRAPKELHLTLEIVTETIRSFIKESLRVGLSGIYYHIDDFCTYDRFSLEEYREWSFIYDVKIMEAAKKAHFNVVRCIVENNMMSEMLDIPTPCWHFDERLKGSPTYQEIVKREQVVMGGISEDALKDRYNKKIKSDIEYMIGQTGGRYLLIAPSVPMNTSIKPDKLKAILGTIREITFEG